LGFAAFGIHVCGNSTFSSFYKSLSELYTFGLPYALDSPKIVSSPLRFYDFFKMYMNPQGSTLQVGDDSHIHMLKKTPRTRPIKMSIGKLNLNFSDAINEVSLKFGPNFKEEIKTILSL